ncbi:MAG: glycoside hydrolase family 15 protein [Elainellaceae cyanobacterium]
MADARQFDFCSAASPRRDLEAYYDEVQALILAKQTPLVGLLPASTAITVHGNYTDAWVRDNVYSILAVWGLALAYRKLDNDQGRGYELEHSTIKLMRGLLYAMMKQADKVERFKVTQAPIDSLHAKYHPVSGDPVVGDDEWGHLQIDAISIYLLMLAQMIASGLNIIQTLDEVSFVQNLAYYIGRAYRTPDYGIWERGNKINHGKPELNASSVGMAKAALEALNGFNLFGVQGGAASVVYVLPDEIARARITLESLLPRESGSKEVDASVLSIIGYPAFAIESVALVNKTREAIASKLEGHYGCKRFLRDGHQAIIEDVTRLHYEPAELKQFEHIECEWPLFFTYLMLDAIAQGDRPTAKRYRDRLDEITVEQGKFHVLPELYYVPEEAIEAERERPSSQKRLPNENLPLVWAQSLYLLGRMLQDGLISMGDIDPLGRYRRLGQHRQPLVQVALLAEDGALQSELAANGIETQTLEELDSIQVRQASELSAIYSQIGRSEKLKLSGRPIRRLRSLTTAHLFRIQGEMVVFLPAFLDQRQFYLTRDYHFLVAQIRGELAYIHRHWHALGRPTVTLLLTNSMFELHRFSSIERSPLLTLIKQLRDGDCDGTPVTLGHLNRFSLTANIERIDHLPDFELARASVQGSVIVSRLLEFSPDRNGPLSYTEEFKIEGERDRGVLLQSLKASQNLYEQIELLDLLARLEGLAFDTGFGEDDEVITVTDLLAEVYTKSSELELWSIIRRAAGLLVKIDIGLSDAVTDILVRQKQIAIGEVYREGCLIQEPMSHGEIVEKIEACCGEDVRERPLTQEILIYLSILIKTNPELFDGLLTLRTGYLILLLTDELSQEKGGSQDEAFELLAQMSPFEVKQRLQHVLEGYSTLGQSLARHESLQVKRRQDIQWALPEKIVFEAVSGGPFGGSWWRHRQREGALNRMPENFYSDVRAVLEHCKGIVIGDKLERRNRLDSELVLSEMTPEEQNFALRVEHLLNKLQAPEYRQITVEALAELAAIAQRNPNLEIESNIVLDVLIGHAVRLAWIDHIVDENLSEAHYDHYVAQAWQRFYEASPRTCAEYIAKALQFLLDLSAGEVGDEVEEETSDPADIPAPSAL